MEETSDLSSHARGLSLRRRVFSLQQANSTLPLVGRVVRDIVGLYRQMAVVQERLASETIGPSDREVVELLAEQQEERFEEYLGELSVIGCELKDAGMGLVDFVGRHEGRDICLCWRLGEEQIAFWHEVHSGFAGRKSVSMLKDERPQPV